MSRRPLPRAALVWVAAAVLFLAAACEKDPNDAATWIPKLNKTETLDEAVRNLERLKDLRAIKPLGEAWKKWNKPSKILRAMINIAQFNDPTGKQAYIKRVPDYKDALPYLIEAVETYDPSIQQSIDDAALAADHLGRSKDPQAIEVLVKTANKSMPKTSPANRVRAAAIRALGNFKDQRAVDTLIKVLSADPEEQNVRLHAAAALALAETGDPKGLPALAKAAFVGPIFNQVRQGFSRSGKPAVATALEIYEGKQADVVAFAKEKDFAKIAPGAMTYKGALLLGDLRATEAAGKLAAGLKNKKNDPIGFDPQTGAPYSFAHMGILDALKRIGDPKTADEVWEYFVAKDTEDFMKPLAIDTYSTLTTSTAHLDEIKKIIEDEEADAQLRFAAMFAWGRLGRTPAHLKEAKDMLARQEARGKALDEQIKKAGDSDTEKLDNLKLINEQMVPLLKDTVARVEIAVECKEDAACYAKALTAQDVAVGKPGLAKAERSLWELRKLGDKAAGVLDQLLSDAVLGTSERIVREGVLLAITRVAPLPCKACQERFDKVLTSQENQTTLDLLTLETRIVYHYFLWAGT
jgi:hypothetical protein